MNIALKITKQSPAWWARLMLFAAATLVTPSATALDFCGCEGHPDSLGDFDMRDQSTWPPGANLVNSSGTMYLTLEVPEDGVMIFDSIVFVGLATFKTTYVQFRRSTSSNPHNRPITLLVAGDVEFACGSNNQCKFSLDISGERGGHGTVNINGIGGAPGPGGFRGGDGAYQDINGASTGGAGLGPGGGLGNGGLGIYSGHPELRPQIGGSGGGGGPSHDTGNCSGGGGGGGGGAITIVANGAVRFTAGSKAGISADGGRHGGSSIASCAANGGAGSGGAIRIVANAVTGLGFLRARGGGDIGSNNDGKIRIEALSDTLPATYIDPPAFRSLVIGPVVNPFASSVAITAVDGEPVPESLTGSVGGIDLIVPTPGDITLQLETKGVPSGTSLDVSVKPNVGGSVLTDSVVLEPANCNNAGECTVFITFDLPSNAYFAEAKATFQVP